MTPHDKLYLDRYEEDHAVIIYQGEEFSMPRELIPSQAAEGDYLALDFKILSRERSRKSDDISAMQERLQRKQGIDE